jgi:hypothetical protein
MPKKPAAPVLLVRWYDYTEWLLERVDSFPKNQRFIFGTRLADAVLGIMELLVEASYSRTKLELLRRADTAPPCENLQCHFKQRTSTTYFLTRSHGGTELGFCAVKKPPCLRVSV